MKQKGKLHQRIEIRCSEEEKNIIKTLAALYSSGNVSAYIIDRVLYSNRKVIRDGQFELSDRRLKKKDPNRAL